MKKTDEFKFKAKPLPKIEVSIAEDDFDPLDAFMMGINQDAAV